MITPHSNPAKAPGAGTGAPAPVNLAALIPLPFPTEPESRRNPRETRTDTLIPALLLAGGISGTEAILWNLLLHAPPAPGAPWPPAEYLAAVAGDLPPRTATRLRGTVRRIAAAAPCLAIPHLGNSTFRALTRWHGIRELLAGGILPARLAGYLVIEYCAGGNPHYSAIRTLKDLARIAGTSPGTICAAAGMMQQHGALTVRQLPHRRQYEYIITPAPAPI